jgi:plastocyanin
MPTLHRPLRTLPATFAAVLACTLALSCGDDSGTGINDDDSAFTGTIRVVDNRFSPADVTIAVGDSVTWRWEGSLAHSVTQGTTPDPSEDGSRLFDSGTRTTGSFGYRFTTPGEVPYFCRPHFAAGMKGVVRVSSP